mgnify:CR=1 FL=1
MNIKPHNRHLLVKMLEEEKEEEKTGFILPDDYEKPKSEYVKVAVLDSSACSIEIGFHVIVPRHMIQEINVGNETFHLVQENYVLASVK